MFPTIKFWVSIAFLSQTSFTGQAEEIHICSCVGHATNFSLPEPNKRTFSFFKGKGPSKDLVLFKSLNKTEKYVRKYEEHFSLHMSDDSVRVNLKDTTHQDAGYYSLEIPRQAQNSKRQVFVFYLEVWNGEKLDISIPGALSFAHSVVVQPDRAYSVDVAFNKTQWANVILTLRNKTFTKQCESPCHFEEVTLTGGGQVTALHVKVKPQACMECRKESTIDVHSDFVQCTKSNNSSSFSALIAVMLVVVTAAIIILLSIMYKHWWRSGDRTTCESKTSSLLQNCIRKTDLPLHEGEELKTALNGISK